MTRMLAVAAALALAGCGGGATDSETQVYRYQINICPSDGPCTQIGRCVNLIQSSGGARYCRQVASYPAPIWSRTASDPQVCTPSDCHEVTVTPAPPSCQAVVECSRPL